MIRTQISNNPLMEIPRFVTVLRIEYLDFVKKEAKILFKLTHENGQGVDVGINNEIWVKITDANLVTETGVVVNYTNIPQLQDETALEYYDRYEAIKANAHPEFTFWWTNGKNVNLETALESGILLLDNLNYFD